VNHLDEISVEELQDALDNVERKKPTKRLLAAIAYKNGVTQTELAEWYDVQRRTIYSWLKRLETDESLERAVSDDKRTGRKRKLSESQQEKFEDTVHNPPEEVGIDAPAWSVPLARYYLAEEFDVEYCERHVRRLMSEAGLSWKTARPEYFKSDERAQEAWQEGFKKSSTVWTINTQS